MDSTGPVGMNKIQAARIIQSSFRRNGYMKDLSRGSQTRSRSLIKKTLHNIYHTHPEKGESLVILAHNTIINTSQAKALKTFDSLVTDDLADRLIHRANERQKVIADLRSMQHNAGLSKSLRQYSKEVTEELIRPEYRDWIDFGCSLLVVRSTVSAQGFLDSLPALKDRIREKIRQVGNSEEFMQFMTNDPILPPRIRYLAGIVVDEIRNPPVVERGQPDSSLGEGGFCRVS